jgi:hypothetical protein
MATEPHPAIVLNVDGTTTCRSLDATDETLYNGLNYQYERRAFFEAIQVHSARAEAAGYIR